MRDHRPIAYARQMRREMTEPEKRLWFKLRAKRFRDIKFRKQKVIGRYIADFSCREPMLVIEIDGDTHGFQQDYDYVRSEYLNGQGYQVIRFTNLDVMENLDGVLTMIAEKVDYITAPLLSPLPGSSLFPEGERAL